MWGVYRYVCVCRVYTGVCVCVVAVCSTRCYFRSGQHDENETRSRSCCCTPRSLRPCPAPSLPSLPPSPVSANGSTSLSIYLALAWATPECVSRELSKFLLYSFLLPSAAFLPGAMNHFILRTVIHNSPKRVGRGEAFTMACNSCLKRTYRLLLMEKKLK